MRRMAVWNCSVDILYLLVPVSIALVFAIGAIFWWALQGGQFEDLEGPAHGILMDDDRMPGKSKGVPPE